MQQELKGWTYYNHALVPTCAPHEEPDLEKLSDAGDVWMSGRGGVKYS